MKWLELSVETEAAAVETVSAVLQEFGEGGVAIYQHVVPDDEDAAYHYDTAKPTTLATYVPANDEGSRKAELIDKALGHLRAFDLARLGPVTTRNVDEDDWANAWKKYFHPMRFGSRLVIKPSWREFHGGSDDIIIHLDPGMAFGTGLHQTTALCLELLERYVTPGDLILDQGTGSGILGIAAARLGGQHITAVDNSDVAVDVARANSELNGVSDRMDVRLGSEIPRPVDGYYSLVIANIIANVIIDVLSAIRDVLAPGGHVILSGIIRDREADVQKALDDLTFATVQREARDEWVALVVQRDAAD